MKQKMTAPARVLRQRRPDGRLYGVIGKSRSGKTVWTARQVAAVPRLLVWDYKNEWSLKYGCRRVSSLHELGACVKPGAPAERLAFCGPGMGKDTFDKFCRLAFQWLQVAIGTIVIEETASVTSVAKAPAAYGDILRMGLGFGADIYALTQRPQESDKTAYGNASMLHCHMMLTDDDQKYVARKLLGVPLEQFSALQPLQYIERFDTGELRTGVVTFDKKSRAARASVRRASRA
jgi:hypothetical protein